MVNVFRLIVAAVAVLQVTPVSAFAEQQRLALVIAQTNYVEDLSPVADAREEAELVADSLGKIGFDVVIEANLSVGDLKISIENLRSRLASAGPDSIGFVYYTGHGIQNPTTGDSYLLGIEAPVSTGQELTSHGIEISDIRDNFLGLDSQALIFVFDACRNIPALGGWSSEIQGLGQVDAATNMIFSYSTDIGEVASESAFAPILAEELIRPGFSIPQLFITVQNRVFEKTNGQQRPWTDNRLYTELCLVSCKPGQDKPDFENISTGDVESLRSMAIDLRLSDTQLASTGENLYQQCLAGFKVSCEGAYAFEVAWKDLSTDPVRSYKVAEHGCELGSGQLCFNLGVDALADSELDVMSPDAVAYFSKACELGYSAGCNNIAAAGGTPDIAPLEAYRIGCQSGSQVSCNNFAGEIYVRWRNSQSLEQDAINFAYQKVAYGCANGNASACVSEGTYLFVGLGPVRNETEGLTRFEKACDLGDVMGCDNYKRFAPRLTVPVIELPTGAVGRKR